MLKIKEKRLIRERLHSALAELDALEQSLREAYICFNGCSEPTILEACIHEISALNARRNAAWQDIRALDGEKIKWQLQ